MILLRSALLEFDRSSFNANLKHFVNIVQSTKRSILLSSVNQNEAICFRRENVNKSIITEPQQLLCQKNIKLFKTCYYFSNRFTVMENCSSGKKNDSCLLFSLAGHPSIGFIQNIIQVRHRELILRICKVNIKNQLCLTFHKKRILCPNIYYGDIDDSSSVFIKPEAIIEKIVYVYDKQLKLYVFFRVPNLSESS